MLNDVHLKWTEEGEGEWWGQGGGRMGQGGAGHTSVNIHVVHHGGVEMRNYYRRECDEDRRHLRREQRQVSRAW